MKKKITIVIISDNETGAVVNAWETEGWTRKSIDDIAAIIGLVDNFKNNILLKKINTLMEKKFDKK